MIESSELGGNRQQPFGARAIEKEDERKWWEDDANVLIISQRNDSEESGARQTRVRTRSGSISVVVQPP